MKNRVLVVLLLFCTVLNAQKFEGLAKTPPMGWNTWNKFACNVDEKMVREMADAIVSSGMKDAGYEYIVIDDCWQISRDENGTIVPDSTRFPSGMKALAGYIHSKGLKFGLYSCAGSRTCEGRPGSRGYEFHDARTYASWDIDYLKYDFCNTDAQKAEGAYKIMRDALFAAKRPIVFSICEWGSTEPWTWGKNVGHLWRTTSDIMNCWDCKVNWGGMGWTLIMDKNADLGRYAGPGGWNDPDILQAGNGVLTDVESRSHFTMWCMMAAPLISGNDLRFMSPAMKEILTNKEIIALDQDTLGKQGYRWWKLDGNIELWIKQLANNEIALCFFNRSDVVKTIDFDWNRYFSNLNGKTYGITGKMIIRDLWLKKNIGTTSTNLRAEIQAHDVLTIRLIK
ncbi:MAG: glycoside hydrolase family 27 protein [Chitinophagaceae bacterium]|nr:glycoside hydrolase family 27 protein [Chitinophagaceae bacterium]